MPLTIHRGCVHIFRFEYTSNDFQHPVAENRYINKTTNVKNETN